MTRFRAAPWLLVLGLTSAVGCGGAEPAPMDPSVQPPAKQAPGQPPAREPVSELSALEHDLAMSEGRLDQHLGRVAYLEPQQSVDYPAPPATAPGPGPTAPPPPATASTAPEPPTPTPGPASAESPVHRKELAGSPCDMACRALASMRRAADGICRLTGAGSPRCELARGRVRRAGERLDEAGCECR